MGRRKRSVHPWSSRELALAECIKALGDDIAREGAEAFRLSSEESFGYRPSGDAFTAWVADLLSAIERKEGVRITGGLATLLWISSGARPPTSEDRFELIRKTWDEQIRRARKRERIGGPGLDGMSVRRIHETLVRGEVHSQARPAFTPEWLQRILGFQLEELGRDAARLPMRDLKALLRKVQRLREGLRKPRPD